MLREAGLRLRSIRFDSIHSLNHSLRLLGFGHPDEGLEFRELRNLVLRQSRNALKDLSACGLGGGPVVVGVAFRARSVRFQGKQAQQLLVGERGHQSLVLFDIGTDAAQLCGGGRVKEGGSLVGIAIGFATRSLLGAIEARPGFLFHGSNGVLDVGLVGCRLGFEPLDDLVQILVSVPKLTGQIQQLLVPIFVESLVPVLVVRIPIGIGLLVVDGLSNFAVLFGQ
mmetsp:Transcript_5993/g.14867  ORF Transcript_5993/g.14867 Transcript_5993/m.14867 type:complete len:225 (+) Transcript_5993:88-762(+)